MQQPDAQRGKGAAPMAPFAPRGHIASGSEREKSSPFMDFFAVKLRCIILSRRSILS